VKNVCKTNKKGGGTAHVCVCVCVCVCVREREKERRRNVCVVCYSTLQLGDIQYKERDSK